MSDAAPPVGYPQAKLIPVSSVVFREDLYPRVADGHSATIVQKYAEDLSVLPPIEINQNDILIDGWHRWTAHKKDKAENIWVTVTETASEFELKLLAAERNSTFGHQMSQADKRDFARDIYNGTADQDRNAVKKRLEKILSVSDRVIRDWLSRIDKDAKDRRNQRIFAMWMACCTQQEIADTTGVSQKEVSRTLDEMAELPESLKPAANHLTDFQVPLYNVWKQQEKTPGSKHFGNSEVRWVDNLLYMYTQPFDVVVDPFGGGGSTIDICKKRFRRYWVSDRRPVVEREKEIRQHDITSGLPELPRWQDVKLVYLDPPYWLQAQGEYSDDPTDLANMRLEDFNVALASLINGFAKKLPDGARIAMIIQPTQWKAPEKRFTDHIADMIKAVKLPIDMRISCPYESQQCTAQMVNWAKENRKILVLSREIVVWRVEKPAKNGKE